MNDFVTIYFSRDRAMQLDLTIRSNLLYRQEACDEFVLYKASEEHKNSYNILKKENPRVTFIEEKNFKEDLLDIIKKYTYVIFVVDDSIFVRAYSLADIEVALDIPHVLGFSLRLGQNTAICYPYDKINDKPVFKETQYSENFYLYNWTKISFGDFGYPFELSSSAYRINDIFSTLEWQNYENPNELEWVMDLTKRMYTTSYPLLACYPVSVAFSNPINKVQTVNKNRSGYREAYNIENLRYAFESGYRIHINNFVSFISTGCHQEAELAFEKI